MLVPARGTITVQITGDNLEEGKTICYHVKDEKIQCEACGLCNGNSSYSKLDVADPVHGVSWKIQNFNKLRGSNG